MAGALAYFWLRRRYSAEAQQWLRLPMECVASLPTGNAGVEHRLKEARVKALIGIGTMYISQGLNHQALEVLAEGEQIYRELSSQQWLAYAIALQVVPAYLSGDYNLGNKKIKEAEELSDKNALAMAMISGVAGYFEPLFIQDPVAARTAILRSYQHAQATGYQWSIYMATTSLVLYWQCLPGVKLDRKRLWLMRSNASHLSPELMVNQRRLPVFWERRRRSAK